MRTIYSVLNSSDQILATPSTGYPQPSITWLKNGQELKPKDGVQISFEHNHARVQLKSVNVKDAGRYTCTAINDVGTASSTADLVVKSRRIQIPTLANFLIGHYYRNRDNIPTRIRKASSGPSGKTR